MIERVVESRLAIQDGSSVENPLHTQTPNTQTPNAQTPSIMAMLYANPIHVRELIPLFQLQAINRDAIISPWDYKQRANLVIVFFHNAACVSCRTRLLNLSQHHPIYRKFDAEVLAIATQLSSKNVESLRDFATEHSIPFPMLWDEQGKVSRAYMGDQTGRSQVGLFICDRYGELYTQSVGDEADELPDEQDIGGWLEFIDMRCF